MIESSYHQITNVHTHVRPSAQKNPDTRKGLGPDRSNLGWQHWRDWKILQSLRLLQDDRCAFGVTSYNNVVQSGAVSN